MTFDALFYAGGLVVVCVAYRYMYADDIAQLISDLKSWMNHEKGE